MPSLALHHELGGDVDIFFDLADAIFHPPEGPVDLELGVDLDGVVGDRGFAGDDDFDRLAEQRQVAGDLGLPFFFARFDAGRFEGDFGELADVEEVGVLEVVRQLLVIGPAGSGIDFDFELAGGGVFEIGDRLDLEGLEAAGVVAIGLFADEIDLRFFGIQREEVGGG